HRGTVVAEPHADGSREQLGRRNGQDDRRPIDRRREHGHAVVRTRRRHPPVRLSSQHRAGVPRWPARVAAGLCRAFPFVGREVRHWTISDFRFDHRSGHRIIGSSDHRIIATMTRINAIGTSVATVALVWLVSTSAPTVLGQNATMQAPHIGEGGLPIFERDPNWPKVPAKWKMGFGSAVTVDDRDHIWILSRPKTLANARSASPDTKTAAAPPVMEFDNDGNFVQGWGGENGPGYQWPSNEHGITVDHKGFVWVVGNADGKSNNPANLPNDNEILKFTRAGKFVMKIGQSGQTGSNKTLVLRGATGLRVYPKTNELFVSDGYGNARIMVFDADTGQFKRMWGAYGNKPLDVEDRPPRSKP